MSRREAWLSAGAVFLLALLVRAWAAAQITFPIPEDATYYWGAARNLAEGNGLTSNTIWSFVTPARAADGTPFLGFPRPAFEIWLPLASFLGAIPMALTGSTTYATALVAAVLVGALLPVLAWRLAADIAAERGLAAGRARTLAIGTGVVAALWMPLVLQGSVLDSTTPFGVAAVAACIIGGRLARRPPAGPFDRRILAFGALIGVAALTRNEAMYVGAAWLLIALAATRGSAARAAGRNLAWVVRVVGAAGIVAVAVMSPWLVRNWLVFGSPLPGQAISNAFSVAGQDIFAWQDRPTLARYLAVGVGEMINHRVVALGHDLVDVLLVPGAPLTLIGILALPWFARERSIRPLLITGAFIFLVTTFAFPVATTWGTFLHASVPVFVLLLVVAMVALDAGLAAVGRRRGWTNPTAWLAPAFAGVAVVLFTLLAILAYGGQSRETGATYAGLGDRMRAAGLRLDDAPVIASHPMWMAEANRIRTLALPDESIASVADLARTFGARYVVVEGEHGGWPARATSDPDAACLTRVPLAAPAGGGTDPFAVFEVKCP